MFRTIGRIVICGFFLYRLIQALQAHDAMNSEEGAPFQD